VFDREMRLGDTIDDYCGRCKLVLDHGIVAIVGGEVRKVRCNTCSFEHGFREGKGGKPKPTKAQSLFDQVAAGLPGYPNAPDKSSTTRKKSPSRKK
jgi:hypothetical protein